MVASRYKFLCGQLEADTQQKFIYYSRSLQLVNDLVVKNDEVQLSTRIRAKHLAALVSSTIYTLAQGNVECVQYMLDDEFVSRLVDGGGLENALLRRSYETLKSVCQQGNDRQMAESYVKFAEYCQALLTDRCNRDSGLLEDFVSAVLTAMSLGSATAARYFPCLLKYSFYKNNERAARIFIDECRNVPSWMFLCWQVYTFWISVALVQTARVYRKSFFLKKPWKNFQKINFSAIYNIYKFQKA